jgi:hypothetical protein
MHSVLTASRNVEEDALHGSSYITNNAGKLEALVRANPLQPISKPESTF